MYGTSFPPLISFPLEHYCGGKSKGQNTVVGVGGQKLPKGYEAVLIKGYKGVGVKNLIFEVT